MTTTENDTEADTHRVAQQAHLAALAALDTKKDQIRYACEQLPSPSGGTVRTWLEHFGVDVSRPNAATVVAEWRREHGIVSTGDLQALTAEMIAELDAARATANSEHRTPDTAEASENRTRATRATRAGVRDSSEHRRLTDRTPRPDTEQSLDIEPDTTLAAPNEHLDGADVCATDTLTGHPGTEHPEGFEHPSGHHAEVFAPVQTNTRPDTEHEQRTVDRTPNEHPGPTPIETGGGEAGEPKKSDRPLVVWPVLLMALSAFVSIWSGWVGLGEMTGFGVVQPFPGISDFKLNTAITLPIGVEAYASYALYVWLSGRARTESTHQFAKWSAFGSLALGAAGQIAYHLLTQSQSEEITRAQDTANTLAQAAGQTAPVIHATAPWWITTGVACLPVIVVGMGAALAHMVRGEREHRTPDRRANTATEQ
ncbi:hypothetical protein DFR70_13027 [Nocardia tenerifensis]|uniref:Uncharacterized protein n=1 Tax=Nocardia tenerifensis TaxID=228006 RepID=A0A318JSJ5_9NOCA|nr:hypothetical protein [Nocardia tenerifensis]PXX52779.1 hypothetical protein DFR70_13027 [Nocardia tenerifensis]